MYDVLRPNCISGMVTINRSHDLKQVGNDVLIINKENIKAKACI